jgi:hypothetical protein
MTYFEIFIIVFVIWLIFESCKDGFRFKKLMKRLDDFECKLKSQNNEDNECNGFDRDGNPIKYGFK